MFAKTPIEPNAIYTRQETANLLGISLSTLKQLIRSGQLKVSQPTGLRRVFIRGSGILEMLEGSEKSSLPMQAEPVDTFALKHSQVKAARPKQAQMRVRPVLPTKTVRASGGANR